MPKAKVESFRLNKEQMQFMKHYKETTKLHKALSAEFNKSLSEADTIRQALTEVEVSMGALVDRAKGFKFDKLEGQDDMPDGTNEQTMPNRQSMEMGGIGMGINNE
jgi:hypothetical protein